MLNAPDSASEVLFGGVSQDIALGDAAVLREVLERDRAKRPADPPESPFLVVLSGLPGTGKSHFARQLGGLVPLLVLESDRLRKVLVPRPKYTPGESRQLFSACHLLLEEYLNLGLGVLFDATNLTQAFRQPLYQIAERTSASVVMIRLTASREIVRQRLTDRVAGRHPSDFSDAGWLVYSRMYPHEEAIQRHHLTVDSSYDTSWALDTVVGMIDSAAHAGSSE